MLDFDLFKLNVKDTRFERKWSLRDIPYQNIEWIIINHPEMFQEIFETRQINNIYFDSMDRQSYEASVIGLAERVKVRLRWYGECFGRIDKPVLEFKIKKNHQVKKLTYPLKPFTLDKNLNNEQLLSLIDASETPDIFKEKIKSLKMVLLNTYIRKYYLSQNKIFRLTLDHQLMVYKLSNFENSFMESNIDHDSIILELKYDYKDEAHADSVSNSFPFRLTKSSKYVSGNDFVYY